MPSSEKTAKHGKHAKHAKVTPSSSSKKKESSASAPKHGKVAEEVDEALFDAADGEADFFAQKTSAIKEAAPKEPEKTVAAKPAVAASASAPAVEDVVEAPVEDEPVASVVAEAQLVMQEEKEPKDRSKMKKVLAITFGSIFGILLIAYIAGVIFFSDRLYPNTKLGDLDVSMKTSADLRQDLNNRVEGYSLTVTNKDGFTCSFNASDIGLALDGSISLSQIVPERTSLTWPLDIFLTHDITRNVGTAYNMVAVQSMLSGSVQQYNESAKQPVSAKIAYNDQTKKCEIVPEILGTALDEAVVSSKVTGAIASLTKELVLDDEALLRPPVLSSDKRMADALAEAERMCKADIIYTLGDAEVARVTPALILTWITLDDSCKAALDDKLLTEWATATAEPLNTRGTERTYTRPDGKVVTVSGGDYGWEVDVEAFVEQVRADVAEGTTKKSAIPCTEDGEGEGFTAVGGADWGPRYVDVDLSEQYARFYGSDGSIIWEADFISGAPGGDRETPTGVYFIKLLESPSKLVGYLSNGQKDYETTVKFWMPFVRNEIGFHDATWQPGFGGNMYRNGYGSHGCINLSYGDADDLYSIIEPNDVVVVHD